MVGAPGSGKSTYLSQFQNDPHVKIISRDTIRLDNLDAIKIGTPARKERNTFKLYCFAIQNAINANYQNIYCDSTQINEASREKLLRHLNTKNYTINAVFFNLPLETCLIRNAQRTGLQCIPDHIIEAMHNNMTDPRKDCRKYNKVIEIRG